MKGCTLLALLCLTNVKRLRRTFYENRAVYLLEFGSGEPGAQRISGMLCATFIEFRMQTQ